MEYVIADLFERPELIPTVARWIHAEFWADKDVHTPASLAALFALATQPNVIPLSLVALSSGEPVGTINLIENDDEGRRHLRPWLAALYVVPDQRCRGIGSSLVRALQKRAASMGIERMYLGTDNPGFYLRLGAVVHERVSDSFCVMRLDTSASRDDG